MFTERAAYMDIFFVGGKREIAHGDSATLKASYRLVFVRKIRLLQPHGLSAEIYGFGPATEEHAGMRVGQHVEFSERHVYVCSSGA